MIMKEELIFLIVITILLLILIGLVIFLITRKKSGQTIDNSKEVKKDIQDQFKYLSEFIKDRLDDKFNSLDNHFVNFERYLEKFKGDLLERIKELKDQIEKNLEQIRKENNQSLDGMRTIVEEKLQKTLEEKVKNSFENVQKHLESVQQAVGEMKKVGEEVGNLQKTLTGVKTKGIYGELQLKAILEDILTKEQYDENVKTKKGSNDMVEFAIKLPGKDGENIYLPIDSKMPLEPYNHLLSMYEEGDKSSIVQSQNELKKQIDKFAKDISSKYIDVPNTTDFAIMFLPTESLYAEVLKLGIIEDLQRKYKINIAGPTTMASILSALRMGFETLSIQKRSSDVWNILKSIKQEFDLFTKSYEQVEKKFSETKNEFENLIGRRTRQLGRKLEKIDLIDFEEDNKS